MYVYVYVYCMCMCMYVYVYVYMYVYVYVYVYVYMYVYVYVCVCMYVYIYAYVFRPRFSDAQPSDIKANNLNSNQAQKTSSLHRLSTCPLSRPGVGGPWASGGQVGGHEGARSDGQAGCRAGRRV